MQELYKCKGCHRKGEKNNVYNKKILGGGGGFMQVHCTVYLYVHIIFCPKMKVRTVFL